MIRKFLSKTRIMDEFDEDMPHADEEYVELDTSYESNESSKVIVRPFSLGDFSDVKQVLDVLREGNTICLVNIKPLREKDIVELKRAINKIKKTVEAISGDIAGFGEDYVVVAPSFAVIHRDNNSTEDLED